MSIGLLRWYVQDGTFRRAASHRLNEHFSDTSVQIWNSTSTWQSRLAPSRPRYSASVNLMMRYTGWCCALYRALQEQGMNQAEACELVETIMSDIYPPVSAALFKLSRLRSAKRETRIKWLMSMITRYFFSSPFRHNHLPSKAGVAFDVTLCPLADYFKDQGAPELTQHAACNLDYCLARKLGVDLIRTQTIADGAAHCEFKWNFMSYPGRS